MAYRNYLASVEWSDIVALREERRSTLTPHYIAAVSHLLAYAVAEQPLGTCLARIIDKGEVLSPSFWHPVRVPVAHSPEAISLLAAELRTALEVLDAGKRHTFELDPAFADLDRVVADAAKNRRGVVSVLEPPADEQRAQRVTCPFDEPEKLPVPWGSLRNINASLLKIKQKR